MHKRQIWLSHAVGLTEGLLQHPEGPHLCAAGEVVKQELKAKLPPVVTVDLQTLGVFIAGCCNCFPAHCFLADMSWLPDQPQSLNVLPGCKHSSEHNDMCPQAALCLLRTASPTCPSYRLLWWQGEGSR